VPDGDEVLESTFLLGEQDGDRVHPGVPREARMGTPGDLTPEPLATLESNLDGLHIHLLLPTSYAVRF